MALRIPVNPDTNPAGVTLAPVSAGSIPDAGGALAEGFASLGQSLQHVQQRHKEEQFQQDSFDLTNKAVAQANDWEAEYARRITDPNLPSGAPGFADGIRNDFNQQAKTLLTQAQQAGADKRALRVFERNLGDTANKFFGQAVSFQLQQANTHAKVQAGTLRDNLSVSVLNNPNSIDDALKLYDSSIDQLPNLTPGEREVEKQASRSQIYMPAALAFGKANAQQVIEALDPNHALSKPAAGGKAANPWAQVAVNVADHFGISPYDLGAAMHLESSLDPTRQNADGYTGLIQLNPADMKRFGVTKDSSPEQWQGAIIKYFEEHKLPKGADLRDIYSTILTGGPGKYDAKDKNGTSVNSALSALQTQHMRAAKQWIGPLTQQLSAADTSAPDSPYDAAGNVAKGYVSTEAPTITAVNPDMGQPLTASDAYHAAAKAEGKTGIPILDVLNAQQRLQVLAEAQNAANQRDANARAEATIQHENITSALKSGQAYGGALPSVEDYTKAGFLPAQAAQMVGQEAALQAAQPIIAGMATMNAAGMQAKVASMKPTDTTSPTFAVDQQVYEAVASAAQENLKKREQDPGAYVQSVFPDLTKKLAGAKDANGMRAGYTAILNAYKQLGMSPSSWTPLTKDQADSAAKAYITANPAQRQGMLDTWFKTLPPEMIRPFVNSLGTADRTATVSLARDAFLYAAIPADHPEKAAVLRDALAGSEQATQDSSRRISSAVVDRNWRDAIGPGAPALNAGAANNYKEVAANLYVAAGGHVPTSQNDPLDRNLWQDSVRRAVGGLKGNKDTGLANFHGKAPTILPPTVTKQEFEGWVDTLTAHTLSVNADGHTGAYNKFGKPVFIRDIQNEGTFVMKSPGKYAIQFSDGGFLNNGHGGDYIINISPKTVRGR